jgi:CheY-like chemotaxis protein
MANLLIIDDDLEASAVLAALLRREGHEVTCAPGAGEALSRLRQADPDLILLDLTMPRVDGLDLLEALADDPRYRNLRVAIYSGRDEPEALNAARRLGAVDYILKGGDWPGTYDRIKACLSGEQLPTLPLA